MTNKQSKPTDNFMSYLSYIKAELERKSLTEDECAIACEFYINGKNPDDCIEKLKKGENK